MDHFIQRETNEGAPASELTEVRLMHDNDNLYIGFGCWDSQINKLVANEMRRDVRLLNNNCVKIFLDTYHDHCTAFCFCTNPLGVQRDSVITTELDENGQNWDWNGIWDNASKIDSTGWSTEIAIPFKTLRFYEGEDFVWGINFARYIPRKREKAFCVPILRDYGW